MAAIGPARPVVHLSLLCFSHHHWAARWTERRAISECSVYSPVAMASIQRIFRKLGLLGLAMAVSGASLQPVTSGWENPTNLSMNIYVPDKLAANPPVILVVSAECLSYEVQHEAD
jgi:hypothetical protein